MSEVLMLSPEKAQLLVEEEKGVFIDVRTVGEALVEQVPGSLFLPFDLVNGERLQGLGINEKVPILVCRSGSRAKQAAAFVSQSGGGVAVLDGGLNSWKNKGLSVLAGRKTIPIDRQVFISVGSLILLFSLLSLVVSPYFLIPSLLMCCGMIFAGITGACGMARVLVIMPWNKAPLCSGGTCGIGQNK